MDVNRRSMVKVQLSFVSGLFVRFQDSSWIEEGNHSNYPVCLRLSNANKSHGEYWSVRSNGPNGTDLLDTSKLFYAPRKQQSKPFRCSYMHRVLVWQINVQWLFKKKKKKHQLRSPESPLSFIRSFHLGNYFSLWSSSRGFYQIIPQFFTLIEEIFSLLKNYPSNWNWFRLLYPSGIMRDILIRDRRRRSARSYVL